MTPIWLEGLDLNAVTAVNQGLETILHTQLALFTAKNGRRLYVTNNVDGKMDISSDEVHKFFRDELGGEQFYNSLGGMPFNNVFTEGRFKSIYFFDHGYATLNLYGKESGYNALNYQGMNENIAKKIRDFVFSHHVEDKKKGRVFVIVRTSSGNEIKNIGVAGVEFQPNNYEVDVVKDYEHVIADFNSPDPCGRLVLLDGPPGTGKTYMVRSLLSACPENTFVLIPPQMVSELSGPDLITCLTAVRAKDSTHPVVLVIEDGERVLLPRMGDNDMSVSSMLNNCDGIFGTILDLRVLVTTNEKNERVDKALKRTGRLCRSIHVGDLSAKRAQQVFERLTGEQRLFNKDVPLSDVYRLARDRGWKAPAAKSEDGVVGFKLESNKSDEPLLLEFEITTTPPDDWPNTL